MNNKTVVLTKDGLKNIEDELEERLNDIRTKIADEIEKAREQGDLSENAAYKSALESKEFNENRINELEDMLKHVKVETKAEKGIVGIGVKVKLLNKKSNNEVDFEIVGQSEADPVQKKISTDSPIGIAIKGKKKDDEVTVDLPSGKVIYKILSIN